jgi:hypothetical protein
MKCQKVLKAELQNIKCMLMEIKSVSMHNLHDKECITQTILMYI